MHVLLYPKHYLFKISEKFSLFLCILWKQFNYKFYYWKLRFRFIEINVPQTRNNGSLNSVYYNVILLITACLLNRNDETI